MKLSITLALTAALVAAAPLGAATRKVPQQHPTIQAAVDAAMPGDVIVIDKGEYAEQVVVDAKSDLTIRGKGKKTRIKGSPGQPAVVVDGSSDVDFVDLRILGANQAFVINDSPRVRIEGCLIEGDEGLRADATPELLVEDCTFTCDDIGVFVFGLTPACVITDCRFLDPGAGLLVGVFLFGNGISAATVTDSVFAGCERGIDGGDFLAADNVFTGCDVGVNLMNGAVFVGIAGNSFKACGTAVLLDQPTTSCVLDDNSIKGGGVGLDLDEATDLLVTRNTVKKTAADAIRIRSGSTGGVVAKNTTVKAGASGLHVEGVGNVFQKNTAKKSAGFDLTDDTNDGDNVFVANTFSKIAP